MYARVLACDFDGTAASKGLLAPAFAAAVSKARAQGHTVLLVTGRVLDELRELAGDLCDFDAIVAENGGLIFFPTSSRTIQLGELPPESFLRELRSRRIPFHAGAVVVGTWESHMSEVFELMRRHAPESQIVFNRGAVMVLPTDVNKATGVRRALSELRRSERNLVAFGDAENDVPLFSTAELAVAAADSLPGVAERADSRLSAVGGEGVAGFINQLLEHGGHFSTPKRHRIALGLSADGTLATIPASGSNIMISGDPRSGKSWIAGLVVERLLERGYRLCIVDAEGEYVSLAARPEVLVLGEDLALPSPKAATRILQEHDLSLVLSLRGLSSSKQVRYATTVINELAACALTTGIPHWIVVDEAQYFFREAQSVAFSKNEAANVLLTTYRPSLIADKVRDSIGTHIIARTAVEEERYFISSLLKRDAPTDLVASEALAQLDLEHVGLLTGEPSSSRWQVFAPGVRVTPHTHHLGKYADTQLPDEKAFRFVCIEEGPPVLAHNVNEFCRAIQSVPQCSLRHHLEKADFSRWATEVLGDPSLAGGLRKLERATEFGAAPNRTEILMQIEARYRLDGQEAAE